VVLAVQCQCLLLGRGRNLWVKLWPNRHFYATARKNANEELSGVDTAILLLPNYFGFCYYCFCYLYCYFMLLFSLMNNSDIIRWSLDLRWQRADRDVGFYNLKQGVRLRSSIDPNLVIDWDAFDAVSRHEQAQNLGPDTTWHSGKVDQVRSVSIKCINVLALKLARLLYICSFWRSNYNQQTIGDY